MNIWAGIGIALILLAFNALFVAAEFALISARRTELEPAAKAGSRTARLALRAIENLAPAIAAIQLGITICGLGLGAVGEPAIAHLLEPLFEAFPMPSGLVHSISFVIALSIVGAAHVVLGEMVPKNLALAGPDRAVLYLGPFMLAVVAALRPVVAVLNLTAKEPTTLEVQRERAQRNLLPALTALVGLITVGLVGWRVYATSRRTREARI